MAKLTREQAEYLRQRIYDLEAEAAKRIKIAHGTPARLPSWNDLWDMVAAGEVEEPVIKLRDYVDPGRFHATIDVEMFIPPEIKNTRFPSKDRISDEGKALLEEVSAACTAAMDSAMLGDATTALSDLVAKLSELSQ